MRVCESEVWLARWNLPILHNFFLITLIIHTNCVITILKALFLTTETKKSTFYLESFYMYCYNVCSPSYRLNTQKTWLKTTITVARVIFISENFDKYLMPFLRIEIAKNCTLKWPFFRTYLEPLTLLVCIQRRAISFRRNLLYLLEYMLSTLIEIRSFLCPKFWGVTKFWFIYCI